METSHWQGVFDIWREKEIENRSKPDVPRGKSLIDVRWILKLKYKNGVFEKQRARIVAKGYLQKKDIDYFESFAH